MEEEATILNEDPVIFSFSGSNGQYDSNSKVLLFADCNGGVIGN